MNDKLTPSNAFSTEKLKKWTRLFWVLAMMPFVLVTSLLLFQSEDDLPPVEMLDNPPELLASVVLADDGETELGRYWKINRTSVQYKDISPYVTDALIATEDERFIDHSGVDFRAIGRAVVNVGGAGGFHRCAHLHLAALEVLHHQLTQSGLVGAQLLGHFEAQI